MREREKISFYFPTIFKLIEVPGNSPYTHNIQFTGEDAKNYTKHFCSEACIGHYYSKYDDMCPCGTHTKDKH